MNDWQRCAIDESICFLTAEAIAFSDSDSFTEVNGDNDAGTKGVTSTAGAGSAVAGGSADAAFDYASVGSCIDDNVIKKCCDDDMMNEFIAAYGPPGAPRDRLGCDCHIRGPSR